MYFFVTLRKNALIFFSKILLCVFKKINLMTQRPLNATSEKIMFNCFLKSFGIKRSKEMPTLISGNEMTGQRHFPRI